VTGGVDWGTKTCAPQDTSVSGPWGKYVRFLAAHYRGKVRYFELWNEPSLHNGWNSSIATLARLQTTARTILHAYGAKLVAPSVAFTNGSPTNGYRWLKSFLSAPGGKNYDVLGLHLYPNDQAARGGYGPEWAMNTGLMYAKKAVRAAHAPNRPIWNTETNVGRQPAHTGYGDGAAGAAAVARTFVLAIENHVGRTIWYGADDRSWGGTFLEGSDFSTLTPAGLAERNVRNLLVGKAALGCRQPRGTRRGAYTCKFGTPRGHQTLLVVWTTGGAKTIHAPKGTKGYYTATGAHGAAARGSAFRVTATPVYLTGSF
jgi:hypothetical protein